MSGFTKPEGDAPGQTSTRAPSLPEPYTPPECDFNDPAALEAWFGNFSWFEHYRKCVLANCRAIVRAKATLEGRKITVDQTDDEAHQHPNYLGFLDEGLQGRILRERNVLASGPQ